MAKNYIQAGEVLTITAAADIASGDPVVIEDIVGVSLSDVPTGEAGAVQIIGVWNLPKVSAGAINQGEKVYLTPGGNITATASGNTYAGFAAMAAADTVTSIHVLLAH